MRRDGVIAELVIQNLEVADSGVYSCVCGEQQTMASLEVNGKSAFMVLLLSTLLGVDPLAFPFLIVLHIFCHPTIKLIIQIESLHM